MASQKPIYLDYNATTPISKQVAEAMLPFLYEHYGNPSSSYLHGIQARQAVDQARQQVAEAINAQAHEIIFTSGGTESNNLALRGYALAHQDVGRHIITSVIEHPAILAVCRYLETIGFHVTYLPVDQYGCVNPSDLERAIRPKTILVSIMHANNEVGTVQPLGELVRITHTAGAVFHTDAAQSMGKIPVNIQDLGVDLLSIAGHKLYAPKGVGALFIRQGVKLENILFGADQEYGLRPGTENVMQIVGLGRAAQQAAENLQNNMEHFLTLRDQLYHGLENALSVQNIRLNGHPEDRLPNTLNVSFKGIKANALLALIRSSIAASAGAACHSGDVSISNVITAMKVPMEWAKGTVRFSVGRMTTRNEIDQAIYILDEAYKSIMQ
jgi:cysteine desulfurase